MLAASAGAQTPAEPAGGTEQPQATSQQATAPKAAAIDVRVPSDTKIGAGVMPEMSPELTNFDAPFFFSKSGFRRAFMSPSPKVELMAPAHAQNFIVDGKLQLSLRQYLQLVLENSTDIEIQRVSLETYQNSIQRAFSTFDPGLTLTFSNQRNIQPSTSLLDGANINKSLSQPFTMGYSQTLTTGTQLSLGTSVSKYSTNSSNATLNPSWNGSFNFGFTQPLLRGRGSYITKLPITLARARLRVNELSLRDQIMSILGNAENAYWDVIQARESLGVQEKGLELADKSLKRSQRELELGAISALEIYQPQQSYANAEIQVTQAKYQLAQAEDALRRQAGLDLDPTLRTTPINLTEEVLPPTDVPPLSKEELVNVAMEHRPDLMSTRENLAVSDLSIQSALNGLRPSLNFIGSAKFQGSGGTQLLRDRVTGALLTTTPGGFGDAWSQVFGFDYPYWSVGISLTLPLRDHRAAADLADAAVNKKLAQLRERQAVQNVRLSVVNAVDQVESSKANVRLAQIAVNFAQERVNGDQRRYDLGTITIFFLLDSQQALTNAEANLVRQSVSYRRNLLNLQQQTGTLLEDRGVVLQ